MKIFMLAVLAFVLSGCATQRLIKDIDELAAGQVLVFGSIDTIITTYIEPSSLLIWSPNSSQAVVYQIDKDRSFAWGLMPGEYNISEDSGIVLAHFTVPQGVKSLYIGKLIRPRGKNRVASIGKNTLRVRDDYNEALEKYRARFANAPDLPQKALMEPGTGIGSFDAIRHICSKGWAVDCTWRLKHPGIEPIPTQNSLYGFPKVDSLKPTLNWQPHSNMNIAYDAVIFEALPYDFGGFKPRYIPGRVAAYEEELKATAWQPDIPLKPNRKYFWSVRLRKNNVVTTWSKYNVVIITFPFLPVPFLVSPEIWFNFSTPTK